MILITGACGLIGSTLAKALSLKNEELLLCDVFNSLDKWENVKDIKGAKFIHFDDLDHALQFYKPKTVFHLAAYTSFNEASFEGFIKNNIGFSRKMLDYVLSNNADFFYASSSATYGDGSLGFSDILTLDELKAIKHTNPYAWSKQQFDFEAQPFIGKTNNRIVGFKFFNTYGENETHKSRVNSASVPYLFKTAILNNEDVVILTDPLKRYAPGHQSRDFINVFDAVDYIQKIAYNSDFNGLINIGSGKAKKFIDVFDSLKSEFKESTSKVIFKEMTIQQAEEYQFYTCAELDNLKILGLKKD
jgi:ADP-L-glycero-D-manno-heptose 6-epimerase